MNDLIYKLNIDKNLLNSALNYYDNNKFKIDKYTKKFINKEYSSLYLKNDLFRLCVVLNSLEYCKLKYDELGISEEIFIDTMSDISNWCENNDNNGLKNYNWIKNHIECNLFKLGRLQFQMTKVYKNYKNSNIKRNDNVIYIHIPQGEKLDINDCENSINAAKDFFKTYFPQHHYEYFFCESWLLYKKNIEFMDKESNIIKFMSLFNIIDSYNIDAQAIERIFGKRHIIKNKYEEKTNLQKSAKQYIINGNSLGEGIGIISK